MVTCEFTHHGNWRFFFCLPHLPCRSWLLHNPLPRGGRSVCRTDLWIDWSPGVVQTSGLHAQHLGVSQAGWQEVTGVQPLKWLIHPPFLSFGVLFFFRAPLSCQCHVLCLPWKLTNNVLSHTWIIPLNKENNLKLLWLFHPIIDPRSVAAQMEVIKMFFFLHLQCPDIAHVDSLGHLL